MSATTVQSFYIAYYGRPADPSGLEYWVGRLEAEGGSFDSIVAAFGTGAESTELFANKTDAEKINAVYQATFGRDADAEGLAFYSAGLADGSFSVYDISKRILDGATSDPVDAAIVANKITVAQAFTDELAADPELAAEYVGIAATAAAKAVIATVGATAESVTSATAAINTLVGLTTYTLTTAADTPSSTDGRDAYVGSISNLGGTLQGTDVIDGGAGSDRLVLDLDIAFGGFTTGSVKNVERVMLTNTGSTSREFNATGITGATTFDIDATNGPITLAGLPTGVTTLGIEGQSGGTSGTTFSSAFTPGAAEQSSSTTAMTLNVENVGTKATARVTATLADVQSLTVNSSGTNFISVGGTQATTLTLSGSGSVDATVASSSKISSVDGSAATGAITLDLSNVSTSYPVSSVKTGAGADSVTVSQGAVKANASFSLGDGADTLVLEGGAATAAYVLSGVETVKFGEVTGAQVHAATNWGDVSAITITDDVAATVTVSALGTRTLDVVSSGDTGNYLTTLDNSGASTLTFAAAGTEALAGTGQDTPAGSVKFSQASGVAVTVAPYVDVAATGDVTASKASTISLTVGTGKNAAGAEQTGFAANLIADKATSFTVVSEGGDIDGLEINAPLATSGSITNSTGSATVTLTDGSKLTSLGLSTGNTLTITDTAALSKLQSLTINAGKGTTSFGAGVFNALNTAILSGSGSTSAVTLSDIGSTKTGYGLDVTASGTLNGASGVDGVAIGQIAVTSGKDVNILLPDVTGEVTIGAIGAIGGTDGTTYGTADTDNKAGNVTISAPKASTGTSSNTGGFTVGDITATGTVDINASSAKAINVGAIEANAVVLNASSVETAAYTLGALTVKSSATLNLNQLGVAKAISVTGMSTSTALTVAIEGGVNQEDLTVTATGDSVASITVSGDLSAADDTVIIDGRSAKAKSISLADLANYANSTIHSSTGNDTISGGEGADFVYIYGGTNTLTGGAGADTFFFQAGTSNYTKVNTITDFGSTDIIKFDVATDLDMAVSADGGSAASGAGGVTDAAGTVAISDTGVATFTHTSASGFNTLAKKAGILSAVLTTAGDAVLFASDSDTYMFVSGGSGSDATNDLVVKLVGVALPTVNAPTDTDAAAYSGTGILGAGS
jgi:hypothetical protein